MHVSPRERLFSLLVNSSLNWKQQKDAHNFKSPWIISCGMFVCWHIYSCYRVCLFFPSVILIELSIIGTRFKVLTPDSASMGSHTTDVPLIKTLLIPWRVCVSVQQHVHNYEGDTLQKCVLLVCVTWARCKNVKMGVFTPLACESQGLKCDRKKVSACLAACANLKNTDVKLRGC